MDENVDQNLEPTSTETDGIGAILEWSKECPDWQRDALQRLCSKDVLDANDLEELLAICKNESAAQPLSADHIRDPAAAGAEVTLAKIHNLQHVNAIRSDQTLTFRKTGLTVVYGDNGAGKSGYARVLKQACRARLPKKGDTILPNIHAAEQGTPQADIEFRIGGQNTSETWQQGLSTNANLSAISVFDSGTANIYVDETNELAYTPMPLKIMEALANACKSLKAKLQAEIDSQGPTPTFQTNPKYGPETTVGKFLANLSSKAAEHQIEELAGLSADEDTRLKQLNADLASDPTQTARRLQRQKSKIEEIILRLNAITNATTTHQIDGLRALKKNYEAAQAAAKLASSNQFADEPLPNVGSEIWRRLWEAAREFSEKSAYPEQTFPVTNKDARCVLCHQELKRNASKRLQSFESFVLDESSKREAEAKSAYLGTKQSVGKQFLPVSKLNEFVALARDDLDDAELAATIRRIGLMAAWQLRVVLRSLESDKNPEPPPTIWRICLMAVRRLWAVFRPLKSDNNPKLPPVSSDKLRAHADAHNQRINALLAEEDASERKAMLKDRDEFAARQWLGQIKDDVLKEIARLTKIKKLEDAQKETATDQITLLSTELAKTLVTDRLCTCFAEEVNKLGIAGLAIELQQASSASGIPRFHIRRKQINKPKDHSVGQTLSEGEHRCVALAAFFAELATANTLSAIVFDDPVSSLDHINRELIAGRLATESLKRQVVIFTHDIAFQVLLEEACRPTGDHGTIPIGYRVVSKVDNTPGFCTSEPLANGLLVEKVLSRMQQHLNNVKNHYKNGRQDAWRREVGSFAKELREAWERAIEEVVSPVIKRLDPKVRTDGLIKLTVIEENDHNVMRRAYGRLSKLLHSQPGEISSTPPSPEEIEQEILVLEKWITKIQKRQENL